MLARELREAFGPEKFAENRDGVLFMVLREFKIPARTCAAIMQEIKEVYNDGGPRVGSNEKGPQAGNGGNDSLRSG